MLTGKVIKPINRGQDDLGRVIDYSIYRGRAVEYVAPIAEYDKLVGGYYIVVWFGMAKTIMGKCSKYPAVDLVAA